VQARMLDLFSSWFWRSQNKREKEKGVMVIKRKIETNRHLFPLSSKRRVCIFVFCILLVNNLYYVIVRFGCIEALGSEGLHNEFLCDCFRQWMYFILREPLKSWCRVRLI
jgi:hypothetical protein